MIILEVKFKRTKILTSETQLVFATKEDIDEMQLAQHQGSKGYLAFSVDEITEKTEAIMKDRRIGVDKTGQTRSQILRGNVWALWDKKHRIEYPVFDVFYDRWMNHFNEQIKLRM